MTIIHSTAYYKS